VNLIKINGEKEWDKSQYEYSLRLYASTAHCSLPTFRLGLLHGVEEPSCLPFPLPAAALWSVVALLWRLLAATLAPSVAHPSLQGLPGHPAVPPLQWGTTCAADPHSAMDALLQALFPSVLVWHLQGMKGICLSLEERAFHGSTQHRPSPTRNSQGCPTAEQETG